MYENENEKKKKNALQQSRSQQLFFSFVVVVAPYLDVLAACFSFDSHSSHQLRPSSSLLPSFLLSFTFLSFFSFTSITLRNNGRHRGKTHLPHPLITSSPHHSTFNSAFAVFNPSSLFLRFRPTTYLILNHGTHTP